MTLSLSGRGNRFAGFKYHKVKRYTPWPLPPLPEQCLLQIGCSIRNNHLILFKLLFQCK
nr:MAG TPA: hypothetical protein [Caudoviricetes sp.]